MYYSIYYLPAALIVAALLHTKEIHSWRTCEPVIALDMEPLVKVPGFASFRGSATVSHQRNRTIHQYLGIPFAVPPMGRLRFKPPVSLHSLNQDVVYDAKYFKANCPQLVKNEDYQYLETHEAAEDCLYLNVFTLSNANQGGPLLPVLVFIHGGSFYEGSASDFCPNYLLDEDIVLVTIAYRLGPLGFLNLGTEDAAGNMGFLDQLEALEWISRNIKYFGGDSNRITVSGQSSGAASVSLMMVSPLVRKGLFQQAIIQSENFLNDMAFDRNSTEHGLEFAKIYANCTQPEVSEIIGCLLKVSAFELTMANNKYMADKIVATKQSMKEIGIAHAVAQTKGSPKFLVEDPFESVKKGNLARIPTIIGVTKDEGAMMMNEFVDRVLKPKFSDLDAVFGTSEALQNYLRMGLFYDFVKFFGASDDTISIMELAKQTYLPANKYNNFNETITGLVSLLSTFLVKSGQLRLARLIYPHSPTYLYSFNFKGTQKFGDPAPVVYFDGVPHCDDLIYLFPNNHSALTASEEKMVKIMSGLWGSFIKSNAGKKPISTPELEKWPRMSTVVGPYLRIDSDPTINENFLVEYTTQVSSLKSASYTVIDFFYHVVFYCLPMVAFLF